MGREVVRISPVWGLVLVLACSSSEDAALDFELGPESCDISSSLALRLADGQTSSYSGCRFRFSGKSKVLTWQLSTPEGSGTWLSPASGWINLSLNGASPEYASLAISNVVSELPADVGADEMVVTVAASGGRVGARGDVSVGRNIVHLDGSGAELEAAFNGVALTDGGSLSGNVSLTAAPTPSNGGGNGADCSSQCPSTCGSGSAPVQACLYCQAACLCECAGDSSCAAANRSSAMQLGTACRR